MRNLWKNNQILDTMDRHIESVQVELNHIFIKMPVSGKAITQNMLSNQ